MDRVAVHDGLAALFGRVLQDEVEQPAGLGDVDGVVGGLPQEPPRLDAIHHVGPFLELGQRRDGGLHGAAGQQCQVASAVQRALRELPFQSEVPFQQPERVEPASVRPHQSFNFASIDFKPALLKL